MKTCAGCSLVWRMISSMPTGVGPSASMTRSRSSSPGGGVAEKSGGSSNCWCSAGWMPALRRDLLDDVAGLGDQDCAVLEQPVGAGRARVERRAGNREDQPSHFAGEPGADQRARAVCRLDDDQPERQAGDQAVAARKIPGARLPAERHFRDHGAAALGDFRGKVDIFGRIGAVEPAGQHGDGSGGQAALMRRGVDAAGQAGDDGIAFAAELGGEHRART